MFSKLTVGKRIVIGFSVILIILGTIVTIGYNKIGYIAQLSSMVQTSIEEDAFLVQKEVDHLNWAKGLTNSMLNDKEIKVQLDPHKCSFGKWLYTLLDDPEIGKKYPPAIIETLRKIEPMHKQLHQSAKNIYKTHTTFDLKILDILEHRWMEHLVWMKNFQMMLLTGRKFTGGLDPHKCKFGKWYYSFNSENNEFLKIIKKMETPHFALHSSAKKAINYYNKNNIRSATKLFHSSTVPALEKLSVIFGEAFTYLGRMKVNKQISKTVYFKETVPALSSTQKSLKELRSKFNHHMISIAGDAAKDLTGTVVFAKRFVLIVGIAAILLGIFLAFIITRSITGPIIKISNGLSDSSNQVSMASTQLSAAGQELSSSPSQQASSIEETSASLEEITGMVNNNVDNAKRCVEISQAVSDTSKKGNSSMRELIESMQQILGSNEKIQHLVKVIAEIGEKTEFIDEIVFQTKLLSFNASVEAERAGEHGRGFAVVAQEVGNLAQMSGSAASEISTIVKDSIKDAESIAIDNKQKVESGNEIVKSTAEILQEIAGQSEVLVKDINSILSASQDQSSGISQINSAVTQLDKATQENAAMAEETASSSEELNAQAENLQDAVEKLTELITGENENSVFSKNSHKKKNTNNIVKIVEHENSEVEYHQSPKEVASLVAVDGDKWERI